MTQTTPRRYAVLLASGSGERARSDTPKQFLKVAGKTVFEHTVELFEHHPEIDAIIVVVSESGRMLAEQLVLENGYGKIRGLVLGGASRRESSAAGIAAIPEDDAWVLVHDIVRPLLDASTISSCLQALGTHVAVDTAVPSPDTIIRTDGEGHIESIPQRDRMMLGQTPQGFHAAVLREAHRRARAEGDPKVTDDCALILKYGLGEVGVVLGSTSNIKITYPSDIYLADRLFQLRTADATGFAAPEDLGGRRFVVFGGSRGIGHGICEQVHARGGQALSYSRGNGVDIADPDDVGRALAEAEGQLGGIDGIAVTSGILRIGLLASQDYDTIGEQVRTNLIGSIVVARESLPYLARTGGSLALFTSSSYTRGRELYSIYSSTKAAIVNLVQALAVEFRPRGVRINAINPARTATPMRFENFGNEPPESLLSPQVVADACIAALCSDISGEVIDVHN